MEYLNAPVVETVIGVQFAPLTAFRSQHYGILWQNYLKNLGWVPVADEALLPVYEERFEDVKLKQSRNDDVALGISKIRMKLKHKDTTRTIQIQPDKLYYSWGRTAADAQNYQIARLEFDGLFEEFQSFAEDNFTGAAQPNLWEIRYINQVPAGELWSCPSDWHRVLPKLFPVVLPGADGIEFATYDGMWYFEIEPKRGRISVRVAKMIVNQTPEPVLFIMLTARGQTDGSCDWKAGLDLGHESCIKLFDEIISEEARLSWRERT